MPAPIDVWVDTDLALGAPGLRARDVDDAFALAAVTRAPGLRLRGVSTVFGNTSSARAARATARLLSTAGVDIPIVTGAARPGEDGPAAAALAAFAALTDGATILALGPLTNVAAALARDPRLAARVTVCVVGGNLASRGRWPPLWPFEFNLAKDAPAAHAVWQSGARLRLYPLDVCRHLTVGARDLLALDGSGALGRFLARGSLRWLLRAPLRYQALDFPLWDLVPALDLAGLLVAHRATRRLRLVGRGRFVDDPAAREVDCLRALDAARAREALFALVAAGRSRGACVL